MSKGLKRKDLKHDEFVEGFVDFGHWLEQNWRTVARWAGVVVGIGIVVGLGFAWVGYNRSKAAGALESGMRSYQRSADSFFADTAELDAALASFEQASSKGGSSATGELARFYQAVTLQRLGRVDEAITALESYLDGADPASTLTWSAQSLMAELLVEAGQADRALSLFQGLVDAPDSGFPIEQALLKVGSLYRRQGNAEEARRHWERLVAEHAQTVSAQEARRLLSQL